MQKIISIQTIATSGLGTLKSLRPDKEGWYNDFPIGVLGQATVSGQLYDPDSYRAAANRETSKFFQGIFQGNLGGEWGHPYCGDISDAQHLINRVAFIDAKNQALAIRSIQERPTGEAGKNLLLSSIKPCGPYGKFLEESLQDATRDTNLSFRGLISSSVKRGNITHSKVKEIITYDAVYTPNVSESSKRVVPATDSYQVECLESVDVTIDDIKAAFQAAEATSMDAANCQCFLDALATDSVELKVDNVIIGVYDTCSGVFCNANGRPGSLAHAALLGAI